MAHVFKLSSRLFRMPFGVSWKSIDASIISSNCSFNSSILAPKLHSTAYISTTCSGASKNTAHDDTKGRFKTDSETKKPKEKHLRMNATIDDNDLDIKIKKIQGWFQKGYAITIRIDINNARADIGKKHSVSVLKKLTEALKADGKAPVPQYKDTHIYIANFKDIVQKTDKA